MGKSLGSDGVLSKMLRKLFMQIFSKPLKATYLASRLHMTNFLIGPMALVLVGAIFVASIETVWHGEVTPPTVKTMRTWQYIRNNAPKLKRGEEMGRFNMGSTIMCHRLDRR
jgi:phosphatidylserine decarboxylase precursor